jgi:hypothetical protein
MHISILAYCIVRMHTHSYIQSILRTYHTVQRTIARLCGLSDCAGKSLPPFYFLSLAVDKVRHHWQ